MATLNTELAQIARECIEEMRQEGWEEQDIFWSTCGGILKQCEATGQIGDDPSKYDMAAIQVLVKQVMAEPTNTDPATIMKPHIPNMHYEELPSWAQPESVLRECPYCHQMHQADLIESCALKPKQGNGTIDTYNVK